MMVGTCFTSFFQVLSMITFYRFTGCATPKGRIYKEKKKNCSQPRRSCRITTSISKSANLERGRAFER